MLSSLNEGRTDKDDLASTANFDCEVQDLFSRVVDAVREVTDINALLEPFPHCVFLKAADGQLLFTNTSFDRMFGKGLTSTGRYSRTFLNEALLPIVEHTDNLILHGCSTVRYDHPGTDSGGKAFLMRSMKKSLLGIGHPKLAILGATQVLKVSDEEPSQRILPLARKWNQFIKLDERDRECAALLAQGEKTKAIAERFGVTLKTVDNRRMAILKALNLKNTMELTRLLCRLQDNGFCDFGL